MTFSEMQLEVFQRIEEESGSPAFCSLIDVKQALNDAYEELSEWSGWKQNDITINKAASNYYDLNSSGVVGSTIVLWPRMVRNDQTNWWMRVGHYRDLDLENFEWQRARGEPDQWFMRGTWTFATFPRLTTPSGTMSMNLVEMPAALSNDSDTPGFPQEFHYGLIEGALADLLAQDREPRLAKAHFTNYERIREALRQWVQKRDALDHRGVLGSGIDG